MIVPVAAGDLVWVVAPLVHLVKQELVLAGPVKFSGFTADPILSAVVLIHVPYYMQILCILYLIRK